MILRVMSYNVRGLKDDRAALRRIIAHVSPDVLLLQEVPRHPLSDHSVAAFAESVGMFWGGGARHRMSTTLFTAPRVDVHSSGHGLYTVPRPQEPRGYGWAEVSLGGSERIVAVSTHMSLYHDLRGPHAEELLADQKIPHDFPWVVGGDFNELSDGPAAKVLTRSLVDIGTREFTSPAISPEKRIDFIYASPQLESTVVPIGPESGTSIGELEAATDHRPVAVDVTLPLG